MNSKDKALLRALGLIIDLISIISHPARAEEIKAARESVDEYRRLSEGESNG